MIFIEDTWNFIRRCSAFTISLIIHTVVIIVLAYTTYYIPAQKEKEDLAAMLMLQQDGQANDRLQFQGRNRLDQFKSKDRMVYPRPEVRPMPILPEVKFYPEPMIREELNLLGVDAMDYQPLTPDSGSMPLHTGEEDLVGSFAKHIQSFREYGLDVVFVFDSTGSMTMILEELKTKITNLSAALKKLVPIARIGMVTYRDTEDAYLAMKHPLTHGTGSLQKFLNGLEAWGGGDREEAVDEGLRVAIETLNWKKKAKKIILLIGDAPPHKKDMTKSVKLIKKFREKMNGAVVTLDTSPQDSLPLALEADMSGSQIRVFKEFKLFADIGGGESARLKDEDKVIRKMVVLIFGSRWEETMDAFIQHL
jgi:hypothetical protein